MLRKRVEFRNWIGVPQDTITVDLNCVEWHLRVVIYDETSVRLNGVLLRDIGVIRDTVNVLNTVELDFFPSFNADGTPIPYIDQLVFSGFHGIDFVGVLMTVHHVP